jgi:hypothetical protein
MAFAGRLLMSKWLFEDNPQVAVFTLKSIVNGGDILYASHDIEDGAWQFLDGNRVSMENSAIVSLRSIVEMDNSINELSDLPLGWIATRSSLMSPWMIEKHT